MRKPIIGETVYVNKDIYRLEERYECDKRESKPPNIHALSYEEIRLIDWRKWDRKYILYAKRGDSGVVVKVFSDRLGDRKKRVREFVQVKVDGKIKTFRSTSLDREI